MDSKPACCSASCSGLALGGILSLILERLDSRLRTSRSVSRATDLPVIAKENTRLPRSQRNGVVVATSPLSGGANSFRMLAAAVSAKIRPEGRSRTGNGSSPWSSS